MNINSISNLTYNYGLNKSSPGKKEEKLESSTEKEKTSETESVQMSAEGKIRQADEFWAAHDALYAEQMATVMNTINDGMQVAQEIARRMSSGATVSPADEQNLMLYDPRMYSAAKNAQMMAQRKEDKSDEVLIDKFVERHANDRKDWTSELDEKIKAMSDATGNTGTATDMSMQSTGIVSQGSEIATPIDIKL